MPYYGTPDNNLIQKMRAVTTSNDEKIIGFFGKTFWRVTFLNLEQIKELNIFRKFNQFDC